MYCLGFDCENAVYDGFGCKYCILDDKVKKKKDCMICQFYKPVWDICGMCKFYEVCPYKYLKRE